MSEPEEIPAGALSLAQRLFPGAGSLSWHPLGSGGISRVWRLVVGDRPAANAVIKETGSVGSDPDFVRREAAAYRDVLPRLGIRTPRLLDSVEHGDVRYLALEDLTTGYGFPAEDHRWTLDEFRCFLPGYAHLHVEGREVGRRPWMLEYGQPTWSPDAVSSQALDLARLGIWGDLPGLSAMARRAFEELASLDGLDTILHLDVHPSNVGLRHAPPCRCALIDWDMTGWGAPEFDLAYLDIQPFGASLGVDRELVLDIYWRERERLGGAVPAAAERNRRQRVADEVFALALVSVAHRSVVQPYAGGSKPARYWNVMRPLLFEKLNGLLTR